MCDLQADFILDAERWQIFRIGTVRYAEGLVTHAQTWASYSALYRFGRLSDTTPELSLTKDLWYLRNAIRNLCTALKNIK